MFSWETEWKFSPSLTEVRASREWKKCQDGTCGTQTSPFPWSLADHLHRDAVPNLANSARAWMPQKHIWSNLQLAECFWLCHFFVSLRQSIADLVIGGSSSTLADGQTICWTGRSMLIRCMRIRFHECAWKQLGSYKEHWALLVWPERDTPKEEYFLVTGL